MSTARDRFDQLCKNGEVVGPVSDFLIYQAEAELGVNFPEEYQELLRKYGAVLANGLEVYGLPVIKEDTPPLWQNVVSVTKQLRAWQQAGADRTSFIPISDDGTGVYFYLDTSVSPATKIFALGPGVNQQFNIGLFDFLIKLADGKIRL
ncbi:SMI1/KNR4 family protein [Devosia sp. MC1541]|uniref:SMI1/KNR4 family protein n=1 Tax=Devosia sp. MC1541 TaxID=2725264 RepID=UPI00145D8978|nr:SMI1/KNR4 family protein [Devosia sp. MC1541]